MCFVGEKHVLPLRAGQQLLVKWYLSEVGETCPSNPLASGPLAGSGGRNSLCEGEVGLVPNV